MQVMYLGRSPRTKETLPDFLKWRLVTRHPLVFHGLMGSQRTPGFGALQRPSNGWVFIWKRSKKCLDANECVAPGSTNVYAS